jgi:very-short-patch-repair endonuclease
MREEMRTLAAQAIREASKNGSKLEVFLQNELPNNGFEVIYHKKGLVLNEDLEIDLFVPNIKTVIEIDGPTHFFPIWGEESLKKHIKADNHKNGLLLQNGYVVIRVKHLCKNLSKKHQRDVLESILKVLKNIEQSFPKKDDRFIELEVI